MSEPTTAAGKPSVAQVAKVQWDGGYKAGYAAALAEHDAEVAALETRIETLKSMTKDEWLAWGKDHDDLVRADERKLLAPYLDHRLGCPGHGRPLQSGYCTCGLAAILIPAEVEGD